MPRGYRHMYYTTGMPGWMRFGYSPGWGGMPYAYPGHQPPTGPVMSREHELTVLRNQTEFLKQQMDHIARRIQELEKEEP